MNKQFVKWMSIFLLLPLGSIAQNLPYDTPAFKAIEKKLKIGRSIGISIPHKQYKVIL